MVGAFGQQWRHNASHHREFQIHPPHQKKEKNEIQQHGRKAANHTQIYARLNSILGQAGHDGGCLLCELHVWWLTVSSV